MLTRRSVTITEPRSTNTPKRSLLGPAKNCVPRTAISAKGLRTLHSRGALCDVHRTATALSAVSSRRRHRQETDRSSAALVRRASPSYSRPSCIPSRDATPVTTSSPRKTGAARSSARRTDSSSANASPLTSSTEPTRSTARAGLRARMNGSASAPLRRSQRRLRKRSRLISSKSGHRRSPSALMFQGAMSSWSQMRAERSVIWFTGRTPFLQSSVASSASSVNSPRFHVSAREQSSPGWSAQGNSARTTSRPLQALKAFYLSERRPKSGTPIQGRGSRVRQVRKAPAASMTSRAMNDKPGPRGGLTARGRHASTGPSAA